MCLLTLYFDLFKQSVMMMCDYDYLDTINENRNVSIFVCSLSFCFSRCVRASLVLVDVMAGLYLKMTFVSH